MKMEMEVEMEEYDGKNIDKLDNTFDSCQFSRAT